jgi:hypothetical protein
MQKRTKNRYKQLNENFLKYLHRNLIGFKHESKPIQLAIVEMILTAPTKYRVHSHQGARFGWQELERKFGRKGFDAVNNRLGLFHIEKDHLGRDSWSKTEGRTKSFMLTDKVSDLREQWLKRAYRRTTNLLTEDGDVIRNVPAQAIYAKRKTATGIEVTREGWHKAYVEPAVPIDESKLKLLAVQLEKMLYAQEFGFFQGELFHKEPNPAYLESLLKIIRLCLSYANNSIQKGYIIQRYSQSPSGRLYGEGLNLQNVPRPVRQAALHGLYDYDIENCHYSILAQMAHKHGYECTAINHYLANKKQVRQQLADVFEISIGQVKQALIALIYGARLSRRPDDALPEILGSAATTAYQNPLFLGLANDIKGAGSAILKGQVISRQTIKSIRGLPMSLVDESGKKVSDKKLLAHLLQGVESLALECAHRLYPESIVLLQHDGWTSTTQLDIKAIEEAILEGTGYRLEVAEEAITCKLDDALADHPDEAINPNQKPVIFSMKTTVFEMKNVS